MLNAMSTGFVNRLRARDAAAWYELWEVFGPVLEAQLSKWGQGRIGRETVRDLSQETLAALSDSIDRYDPSKGARFSTWLLAIAKHTLGDEIDRRMAQKRGSGRRAAALDEAWMAQADGRSPDGEYEAAVFAAKVCAAIRAVEKEVEFADFAVYRMRVLDGMSGKEVAEHLGTSEPTVSRKLGKVRSVLRLRIGEMVATYSFVSEELEEAERKGLASDPKKADDALFDDAVAEVYHGEVRRRGGGPGAGGAGSAGGGVGSVGSSSAR